MKTEDESEARWSFLHETAAGSTSIAAWEFLHVFPLGVAQVIIYTVTTVLVVVAIKHHRKTKRVS